MDCRLTGAVVEQLLKGLDAERLHSVRQFFSLANQHTR
jgi:hypothetical protein